MYLLHLIPNGKNVLAIAVREFSNIQLFSQKYYQATTETFI